MNTIFEYKVTNLEGQTYTLITSNDPFTAEDLIAVETIGEYSPTTTQDKWVLA